MTSDLKDSIHAVGRQAAMMHKWIESEKAGRDLGELAIHDWLRQHWRPFYRACAFEHLLGARQWSEMDPAQFGLLYGELAKQPLLAMPLLEQLRSGRDNLEIIHWAYREGLPLEFVYQALSITNTYRYSGWSTLAFALSVAEWN